VNEPANPIVCGNVDREGRLLSADPRLLALQLGAGGEADGTLAIPQLASLARLARTLGVVVSRGIIAADGDIDLDLWVRAQPEGDEIRLAIAGWAERTKPDLSSDYLAARTRDLSVLGMDGDWATDVSLKITSVDAGLGGAAPNGGLGLRLTQLVELIDPEDEESLLMMGVLDRQPFAGQKARLRSDDDSLLWLHGAPTYDGAGILTGYAGGFRWISAPFRSATPIDERTNHAGDERFAKRLDAALRRPLGRIIANADEMVTRVDGALGDDYAGYAGDIASAGRHLLGLVDDLSDLQAVERDDFKIEEEPVDLADIARRAASLLRVRASDRDVRIDPPLEDETLWAKGEFRRILQIMVNLVGNAVRYSPAGSMVWIRIEREGDLAALIVADQGKGIEKADQERIFGKFERVDQNEPGGTGLGLYISRRLARAMGGDITVDSAPGMGARFVLTLPAVESES
jgi:signal transduction histidine kinase